MRATKITVVLMALAICGLSLVLLLQQQRLNQLRSADVQLRQQLEASLAAREFRPSPETAKQGALAPEQRTELLRLRGEVTRLRSELGRSKPGPAGAGATNTSDTSAVTASPTEQTPFLAANTVNVASGESFATGGWITSPGFRTFLLTTPTLGKNDSGGTGVTIAMSLLKVPDGELPEALQRRLASLSAAESPAFTGMDAAFFSALANTGNNTNILSRPRIATSDGTPASLFIGQTRPNPDGTQRQIGTLIKVSPEVAADGQTIRMAVDVEYTPQEE